MLAKIAPPTNDFHALARYLVRGKPGRTPHPQRVAWIATQNLGTEDPELAATYMAVTAAASRRVKRAAYHLMIAWHANEYPRAEQMQEIARETLALAGLGEHQALIMGHGDKPHPHLHILLNRVHPDSGRAWSTGHDFRRFDDIMRRLSEAYGFRYVPGHAFNPELTDEMPLKPDSRATYAAKRGAQTQRLQWSRASARTFGAELSEELGHAPTAEEIAELVAKRGLALEKKGRGFVVGNAVSYAKLSRMGLAVNGRHAPREKTPWCPPPPTGHAFWHVDGVDIVRALRQYGLTDREDLKRAIHERQLERAARREARASSQSGAIIPSLLSATHLRSQADQCRTTALLQKTSNNQPIAKSANRCTPRMHID